LKKVNPERFQDTN